MVKDQQKKKKGTKWSCFLLAEPLISASRWHQVQRTAWTFENTFRPSTNWLIDGIPLINFTQSKTTILTIPRPTLGTNRNHSREGNSDYALKTKTNTGGFQQKQISLKPLILCTWNFGGILAIANGLSRPNFMPSQQGNQQLHLNRRNSRKLQRRLTKSKLLHGLKSFANEILQLC